MNTTVELSTYLLPDDHKVFKFFPGKSYKFQDLVLQTSVALIDVRNLAKLGDPATWQDDKLLDHIAADRVERRVEAGAKRPTRIVRSQGDKATLTFLRGLLFTAKKGDLIVMPDKGYTTEVWIGMFADNPGTLKRIEAKDDSGIDEYFGRRVKWVGSIEKRKLSDPIISQLHSRAAFFDIGRSYYEEIYSKSFDDYVYDGQNVTTFRTSKNIFTSKDNLLSSAFFELVEVLDEARTSGTALQFESIYELAFESDIDEDERNDLTISVQSPGWFRWRSLTIEPLAAMALFTLATAGISYNDARAATVTAQIVRQADDQCLGEVDKAVKDYLELLGKDRWEQACKLATKAQAQATLTTKAKITAIKPRLKINPKRDTSAK